MNEFEFAAPTTVDEAVGLMGADARALAGGTDLLVQMREGRRRVGRVVDMKRIPELTSVTEQKDGSVTVGAALNVTAMAAHPAMRRYPSIVEAGRMIGSYQIQNRAGIGGNLCNASPSADAVPPLLCHGALAVIAGPSGRREVPVESLFVGPGKTTLAPQEILVCLRLPRPPERSAGKYIRFTPRREMDIAVAGSGTWIKLGPDGTIAEARVALAAVAPTPVRATAAEKRLIGERPTATLLDEAGQRAARDIKPISDTRGSAEYRRELVRVLTARALAACCAELGFALEVE